ncbi:MAG: bifunctional 5,10-methylene-tetrahydrofolate dehydrogenase/5,10-methylene-tetrahydrofolate cyclohydrolase [Parachlamydiales bacterium]|nr:bifunctional 5,10-methylene-tetrahydrofolate dehydrogenase/5,10-methylene-tetrahydrofolate cyclohydrolase [Parachlamydiales bacterium]
MIINGKEIAKEIALKIKAKLDNLKPKKPNLSVILVGNNSASLTYIRMKKKACDHVGIDFDLYHLDENIDEKALLKKISYLNNDPKVNGILVQMPLPKKINENEIILSINPKKDVDGFHPLNVGKALIGDDSGFLSCTPLGIKILLEKSNIDIQGKHVVIVGRSNIVGKPLAAILMQKKPFCNATVTVAHSYSRDLIQITRSADVLVAAIGKPKFITKDMVKTGSVVIDVGINLEKQSDSTTKLVGDVDFENVKDIASYITPVPGGVGPMTIACLLHNVYKSFIQTV